MSTTGAPSTVDTSDVQLNGSLTGTDTPESEFFLLSVGPSEKPRPLNTCLGLDDAKPLTSSVLKCYHGNNNNDAPDTTSHGVSSLADFSPTATMSSSPPGGALQRHDGYNISVTTEEAPLAMSSDEDLSQDGKKEDNSTPPSSSGPDLRSSLVSAASSAGVSAEDTAQELTTSTVETSGGCEMGNVESSSSPESPVISVESNKMKESNVVAVDNTVTGNVSSTNNNHNNNKKTPQIIVDVERNPAASLSDDKEDGRKNILGGFQNITQLSSASAGPLLVHTPLHGENHSHIIVHQAQETSSTSSELTQGPQVNQPPRRASLDLDNNSSPSTCSRESVSRVQPSDVVGVPEDHGHWSTMGLPGSRLISASSSTRDMSQIKSVVLRRLAAATVEGEDDRVMLPIPAMVYTDSKPKELSWDFILHIKKLLSLPNLTKEWRDQLNRILQHEETFPNGPEDRAVHHASFTEISTVVAHIINGLIQNSGLSGLSVLADAASETSTSVSSVASSQTSQSEASEFDYHSDTNIFGSTKVIQKVENISTPKISLVSVASGETLPTLFQLIRKIEDRELQLARAGVGSIPELSSLSTMAHEVTPNEDDLESDPRLVFDLVQTVVKRSMGLQPCDGVGSLPDMFQTPSCLLAKHEQQEAMDPSKMSQEEWAAVETKFKGRSSLPSIDLCQVLNTQLKERCKPLGNGEKSDQSGQKEQADPSASKLLKKVVDRELQDKRMGVGSFETLQGGTVSKLLAKVEQQELQAERMGVGSIEALASGTPSKLMAKVEQQELQAERMGVGSIEALASGTPSKLMAKVEQQELQAERMGVGSIEALASGTPSKLMAKVEQQELQAERMGVGSIEALASGTPSKLMAKVEQQELQAEKMGVGSIEALASGTPSKLMAKVEQQELQAERMGVGSIEALASGTPSKLMAKVEQQELQAERMGVGSIEALASGTPSKLMAKVEQQELQAERMGVGSIEALASGTPSKLMAKIEQLEHQNERAGFGSFQTLEDGSPSRLLARIEHEELRQYWQQQQDGTDPPPTNAYTILTAQSRDPREASKSTQSAVDCPISPQEGMRDPRLAISLSGDEAKHGHLPVPDPGLKQKVYTSFFKVDMLSSPTKDTDSNTDGLTVSDLLGTNRQTDTTSSRPCGNVEGFTLPCCTPVHDPRCPDAVDCPSLDILSLSMLQDPTGSLGSPGNMQDPTARIVSPGNTRSPQQTLETGQKTPGSSSELRSFIVEKELFESKLRQLQVENSGLLVENKQTKEKLNRAQARCQYLKAQLGSSQEELCSLQNHYREEVTAVKRRSLDRSDRDRTYLHDQVARLGRDLEVVRAQNALLEKQLEKNARSITNNSQGTPDWSKFMESYKADVNTLKDELEKSRTLRVQSELDRKQESEGRKEAARQIIRLTELKALLQQQLENAGAGSVAEKQVQSLERRLKITEDRLHQERADRAGKLSEVEEKLINDNARLQVSSKESSRQLQRERDKNRNLSDKYKDARSELDRLQVALMDKPSILDNTPYIAKMADMRSALGSKKHVEEVRFILDQIEKDHSLGADQETDMIWLLWHQREELNKLLREWEVALGNLNLKAENVSDALEMLQADRQTTDAQLQKSQELLQDVQRERDELLSTFQLQVETLTRDKHDVVVRVKDLEDLNAALTAENDSLKHSLRSSTAETGASRSANTHNMEAQLESLRGELRVAQGDLHQAVRGQQSAESQLHSLHCQLTNKQQALAQALATLDHQEVTRHVRSPDPGLQVRVDTLNAQVEGLEADVRSWRDKYERLKPDLETAEDENERLRTKSLQLRVTAVSEQISETETDTPTLGSDLRDRDDQIYSLTVQSAESEHELQRARQRLLVEEQHSEGLASQLEQLQTQLRQKNHVLDRMASAESDYQVELKALRDNMATVNRELTQKSQELKLLVLDLGRERTKTQKLTQDISEREQLLSHDITTLHQGAITSSLYQDSVLASSGATLAKAEIKVRLADYEKESLRHDVQTANDMIQAMVRENAELSTRVLEVRQELLAEQTHVARAVTDRADMEQKEHLVREERDAAVRQRALLEQELVRHETQTRGVIERLEQEALQARTDHQQRYHELDTEGKKMAVELGTAKRLLEARELEIDVLTDAVFRQKEEVNALHRRVATLTEEYAVCRQNSNKLSQQLSLKMKDTALTMETHQALSSARTKLQMDKYQLETELSRARTETEHCKAEVTDYKRKLEGAESLMCDLELRWQEKDVKVSELESSIYDTTRECHCVQTEVGEAKALAEALNREIYALHDPATVGAASEGIFEERTAKNTLREELTQALHQVTLIREEYSSYTSKLQAERQTVNTLKEKYQCEEDRAVRLDDRLGIQEAEIATLRGHLDDTRRNMDVYKMDKQSLYKDVQDLLRQLSDKDDLVTSLQTKCAQTAETAHRERLTEKEYMEQTSQLTQGNLHKLRQELEETKDSLRQKEVQLEIFYKTSRDLQHESRAKGDLEEQMTLMQAELSQTTWNNSSLNSDIMRLQETLKNTQENLAKSQQGEMSLKEQLQQQREELTQEIKGLRTSLSDQTHRSNAEVRTLQDRYTKTQADLCAAKASLAAFTETKHSLYQSNRQLDVTVESLKVQLHEEVTVRRLTEQRLEDLQSEHRGAKAKVTASLEKIAELQSQLSKSESDVTIEREKYRKLKRDLVETRSSNMTQEQHVESLQMQVAELQAEVSSLKNQLESCRQELGGKNKRLALELKHRADDQEQERAKLLQQVQTLSQDVELVREQLAAKSREHLRLQEENLTLDERAREAGRQARQATDGLTEERAARESLENRNMGLEILLAKLQKDSDDVNFESTRAEVTRMLGELSRRMQLQLEQQRGSESEARARDLRKIEELKNKMTSVEAGISQEQAMHIVTKTQIASLEEDNMRLRQQLQMIRKRTSPSGESERTKSRLEEINEIIARSQTRAQQLLASGAYTDDQTRSMSPLRDVPMASNFTSPGTPIRHPYSASSGMEDASFSGLTNGGLNTKH